MSDEAQEISFRRKQEKKALDRRGELLYQWDESLPEIDKDIIRLELLELDIRPYSLNWRFGMVGALRRARKALEKKKKERDVHA